MVGGAVEASFERAAKYGDGWTQGGSGASQFGADLSNLDDAWKKAGRDGQPRTLALAYFCLGPDAEANAQAYVGDYYAWLGDEAVQGIAAERAQGRRQRQGVHEGVRGVEVRRAHPLPLLSSDPAQVGLLAEAAGL